MPRAPARRRLSVVGFGHATALMALAGWMGRSLPEPGVLLPAVATPPLQRPTDAAPFEFDYKGKRCEVRPVAAYQLTGLVVSHNDIRSFSDIYHDATSVDTRDLCVIWGEDATGGAYRDVEFWSGPFTCCAVRMRQARPVGVSTRQGSPIIVSPAGSAAIRLCRRQLRPRSSETLSQQA